MPVELFAGKGACLRRITEDLMLDKWILADGHAKRASRRLPGDARCRFGYRSASK
jgi:hypothetical protein